jgi:hypothetical protein
VTAATTAICVTDVARNVAGPTAPRTTNSTVHTTHVAGTNTAASANQRSCARASPLDRR